AEEPNRRGAEIVFALDVNEMLHPIEHGRSAAHAFRIVDRIADIVRVLLVVVEGIAIADADADQAGQARVEIEVGEVADRGGIDAAEADGNGPARDDLGLARVNKRILEVERVALGEAVIDPRIKL